MVAETQEEGHRLKKVLGPFNLIALGIGAIIGAGIFATIGTAAAGDATRPGRGPGAHPLVRPHGRRLRLRGALLRRVRGDGARSPGSAYTYSYATLGELVAWIIGWDLIIEYAVGNVAVAISWGELLQDASSRASASSFPHWLSTDYRTAAHIPGLFASAPHLFGVPIVFNILAFAIVALITVVLVIGIRESALAQRRAWWSLKLVVLAFFVLVGWTLHRSRPTGTRSRRTAGRASRRARRSSSSPTSASTPSRPCAEEVREPEARLPIGIIGSLVICTVIYIVVAAVFTGIIPYRVLVTKLATEQAEPLTMALQYANIAMRRTGRRHRRLRLGRRAHGRAARLPARPAAHLLLDGARRPAAAESSRRCTRASGRRTSRRSSRASPSASCAMFTSIDEMVDLTNIGTLFAFILVCIGIIDPAVQGSRAARGRSGSRSGPFLLPILGVLISCAFLIIYLPPASWLRFVGWLAVGLRHLLRLRLPPFASAP